MTESIDEERTWNLDDNPFIKDLIRNLKTGKMVSGKRQQVIATLCVDGERYVLTLKEAREEAG